MKNIAILVVCVSIAAAIGWFFFLKQTKTISPLAQFIPQNGKPTSSVSQSPSRSLFVPYWSFGTEKIVTDEYDTLLYFGVSANQEGIDTEDVGYKKLAQFVEVTDTKPKKLLVIRMISSEVNSKVLDDENTQKKIIQDAIATAKDNGFSGIVLDFEIKALAFDSVVQKISKFYTLFSSAAHKNKLVFDATLYGDTFYRARPYNVKEIGKMVDHIYIMTYDFHKAGGNPGPNFPLMGKNTYGYDLETMIGDFQNDVDQQKLIVTLGLFGYDWTVDEKNQSKKTAIPLSFSQINQKYLTHCDEKNCKVKKDPASLETNITYTDGSGDNHSIWFEDLASSEKKKTYLSSVGLNALAFWAYSYY